MRKEACAVRLARIRAEIEQRISERIVTGGLDAVRAFVAAEKKRGSCASDQNEGKP